MPESRLLSYGFKFLAAVFLSAALAGCGTMQVGRDFDLQRFESQVKRGVTTKGEIRAWLGAPAATGTAVNARGEHLLQWTYYHGRGRMGRMSQVEFRILEIQFNDNGVVQSYNWSGTVNKGSSE